MKLNVLLSLAVCLVAQSVPHVFAVEDVTSADIEAKLEAHDLAVVEVYKPGCSFCLKMFQVIQKFERANPSTPVYRVLVSDEGFKAKYKVHDIPAFLVFKRGLFSHVFFGLMDSDQFYQSVYFSPVTVRDPEAVVYGLGELMGGQLPVDMKLVRVPGGFFAITDTAEKVGYGKVYLDGSVFDATGQFIGTVYTPVPAGACCSGGNK